MAVQWGYEKLTEDLKIKHAPRDDMDGSITGHIVYGLKAWFDENPEERIRLGWIKHIYGRTSEIEYNRQSQYLQRVQRQIDEYTIQDEYLVMDKSEEMMRLEELTGRGDWPDGGIVFYGGEFIGE